MRFAILASHLSALCGVQGRGVKDFRARDWLPLFEAADKPRTAADGRKDIERLRLVFRALAGAKLAKKSKPKGG